MQLITPNSIMPAVGDRVGIFGQTGSGKTTLARVILQEREHVVILDPKRSIDWPGYTVLSYNDLISVDPQKVKRIIYKPTYTEITANKGERIEGFFRWIFERENTTLYIDETSMIANGDDYPFHYGACIMQGREKGIEVISVSQRPTWIPQIAMSEAEHVYCFKLKLFADRQRIERLTGIEQEKIEELQKKEFLYAPQDGDVIGPLMLQIRNKMAA